MNWLKVNNDTIIFCLAELNSFHDDELSTVTELNTELNWIIFGIIIFLFINLKLLWNNRYC